MNEQERQNLFADLITSHQSKLYSYIYAMVRNWQDADDLFQAVCLVLWSKFESFQQGTSFFAWGREIARIKVCDFFRHRKSALYVTENMMDILTEIAGDPRDDIGDEYLVSLRRCQEKLNPADDELLRLRYVDELGTVEIADRL
jgi:RNA polymerase sigma-70 factor (ECF subfamily)